MARRTRPWQEVSRETTAWRFTDAENKHPHYVYRLFGKDGALLYIGCAADVEHRVYMHLQTYTMVDAFLIHRHYDRHTSEAHPTKLAARQAEAKAIRTERPLLNRQHNPTRWRRIDGVWTPVDKETADAMNALSKPPEPNPETVAFLDALSRRVFATP